MSGATRTMREPLDIEVIKERRAAIGAGDWKRGDCRIICAEEGMDGSNYANYSLAQLVLFDEYRTDPLSAEAEFIINAPSDLEALIAEVEELREIVDNADWHPIAGTV